MYEKDICGAFLPFNTRWDVAKDWVSSCKTKKSKAMFPWCDIFTYVVSCHYECVHRGTYIYIYIYIYKQIYNHRNYLCNKVRTNTQNGFYDLGLGLLAFKMSIPTINFLSPQRNLINCNENNFFKMDGFQQLCRYRANGAGHVVALDQTIE